MTIYNKHDEAKIKCICSVPLYIISGCYKLHRSRTSQRKDNQVSDGFTLVVVHVAI